MNKKVLSACLALAFGAGAGYALNAVAQAKPDTLVKQRQAVMTLQGKYLGPLIGMAKGKSDYNGAIVARNAGYLDVLNKMPWDGFTPETKGVESRALPTIWEQPAKFEEAQKKFQGEVTKLVSASKDEAAAKAQIIAVLNACNACHDDFRAKK